MTCCCTDALTLGRTSSTFKKIVTPYATGSGTIILPWTHQSASIWSWPPSGNKPAPPLSYWRISHLNVLIPSNVLVLFYLQTSPGHHRLNLFAPKPENTWGCYTDVSIITLEQTPFLNYTLRLSDLTWNIQPLFGILLQPIILTNWKTLRSLSWEFVPGSGIWVIRSYSN